MIDVFMTVHPGGPSSACSASSPSVTPGPGIAFASAGVVILTMLAAFSFDPRLMWDAAGQTACAKAEAEA